MLSYALFQNPDLSKIPSECVWPFPLISNPSMADICHELPWVRAEGPLANVMPFQYLLENF